MHQPMSKPRKGKVSRSSASKARSTNRHPKGNDAKGIHPMTGKTGSKKMSRVLKGVDTRKGGKSVVVSDKANKLDGKWF